jgi:hypothetical protein
MGQDNVLDEAAPASAGVAGGSTTSSASAPLEWDINVALVTNRHMLFGMAMAMLGGALGCALLVSVPIAVAGEWDTIGDIFMLFAMVGTGLWVLSLAIMIVLFRNRMRMRFRIDGRGVAMSQIDRTARAGNRAALLAGLALGRPSVAGSGALAMSQEQQALVWSGGAFVARYEPSTRSIAFRNGWRTLLRVYCLPENYDAVAAMVAARMARGGAAARVQARSPLGGYLWRTLLVTIACVPLFAVAERFDLSTFTPFLLLCFTLAMVWLVRPLAWVVLGALGWFAASLAVALSEQRQSMFDGEVYRRYEVVDGDGWALIVIGALGSLTLGWLALAILRGRIAAALSRDMEDAGDA